MLIINKSMSIKNNITPIQKKKKAKKLWSTPWLYKESLLIALFVFLTGIVIELLTVSRGISVPRFPHNMFALMVYITTLMFLHIFYRKSFMVKWLTSIPAAISSVFLLSVIVLLLGFLRQENQVGSFLTAIGFTHIKNSWVLIMAQLYVLTVLGLSILKRSTKLTRKNAGFLLNHTGLWIVIVAAGLGTGDLQRLKMELHQDETVWYAYDDQRRMYELPFAVKLLDFNIEEYPPKMALVDGKTGKFLINANYALPEIQEGKEDVLGNYKIVVEKFLNSAWPSKSEFIKSDKKGAPPAAKVMVMDIMNGDTISGWISCGSFMVAPAYLFLDNNQVLAMTEPEPEKYQSFVRIYTEDDDPYNEIIEVNAAPKVKGWHLYQVSYDQSMGKWSKLSVLEVVRDPWLYIVYFGIALLLAGAVYILWMGAGAVSDD